MKLYGIAVAWACAVLAHQSAYANADLLTATKQEAKEEGRNLKGELDGGQKRDPILGAIDVGPYRPEGVTEGPGATIFVSQFAFGGITGVNVLSGKVRTVVPPQPFPFARGSYGLWYDSGAIFAAGGGKMTGNAATELHVYDANTGEHIVSCLAPDQESSFLNDVTVTNGKAYVTDSSNNSLVVVEVEPALSGTCQVSSVVLPDDFQSSGQPFDFRANGIAPYRDGVIVGNSELGSVYYIDPMSEEATKIVADGEANGVDGIVVLDGKMYLTQNSLKQIAVWSLSGGKDGRNVRAVKEGEMTSPLFDSPATSAIYRGTIYSANARFESLLFPAEGELDPATFEEEFQIVGIQNIFGRECKA